MPAISALLLNFICKCRWKKHTKHLPLDSMVHLHNSVFLPTKPSTLSRQMIFLCQSQGTKIDVWIILRTKKLVQDFARVGYNILGTLSKPDYLLPHKSKQKNMLKFSNEGLEHANFLLMRRQFLDRLFQVEITSTMGAQYILFAQWRIFNLYLLGLI